MRASAIALAVLAVPVLGCGEDDARIVPDGALDAGASDAYVVEDDAGAYDPGPPLSDFVATACSTTVVVGLSRQLVDELECLMPGVMGPIDGYPEVVLGDAAFPFIQGRAAEALGRAAAAAGRVTVNSSLRTLPQQYLLYQWYRAGRCGISLAAQPGRSNHESGLAVDVAERDAIRAEMEAEGFGWLGASDPVHYDYAGAGAVDLRMLSVLAFQRLWNVNNPDDPITEDGLYGPETEGRLALAPSNGFRVGASCGSTSSALVGGAREPAPSPHCAR
jgi:hypothetical protein